MARCQNLYVPVDAHKKGDDEEAFRVAILNKDWRTLHHQFLKFAREHINDFELLDSDSLDLRCFIQCHVRVLRRYKKNRPGQSTHDPLQHYFVTTRLNVYEGARRHWLLLNDLHQKISMAHDDWYAEVLDASFQLGTIYQQMEEIIDGSKNYGEFHIQTTAARRKGAMTRNIENHAMKVEVFDWLDTNMVHFKSMDAAAEGIAGKIAPIAFRTARDWVGEWKRLRSASTA
jgi:hypothetical protein